MTNIFNKLTNTQPKDSTVEYNKRDIEIMISRVQAFKALETVDINSSLCHLAFKIINEILTGRNENYIKISEAAIEHSLAPIEEIWSEDGTEMHTFREEVFLILFRENRAKLLELGFMKELLPTGSK